MNAPGTARPRLVMTMKVRDEADVIAENLRFHSALGVDFFLVTDNGSVDGTLDILARWERAGRARVLHETGEMGAEGNEWLTRMARLAATEHDAGWVLHTDADEFWWPVEGNLRTTLAAIPESFGAVFAPRAEFVGRPDGAGTFADRLIVREAHSRLRPKVAHRATEGAVVLHRGGHDVVDAPGGSVRDALRPPGRAVLRAVREERAGDDTALVPAPRWPIRILHFPLRSSSHYRRRVELGLASFPDQKGWQRLREAGERGELDRLYESIIYTDEAVAEGIASGALVEDPRLRDFLPRCPDPIEGEAAELTVPTPEDAARRSELDELAADAMRTLARHQRLFEVRLYESRERIVELRGELSTVRHDFRVERRKATRRRRAIRKLRARAKRAERRLAAERRRPWSRLMRLLRVRR